MKKGDKVFVLVEHYVYDFESEIRTSVFLSPEDAYKALADAKNAELKKGLGARFNKKDLEISEDSCDSFDIYLEGRPSTYETHLWVAEKKII